ncbi:hypothetical protein CPC08DRAFT_527441 [Agrocybe pediades]|nr:hypothetical protein CPC08DRAFT_527441 [Agrocybe pediades]
MVEDLGADKTLLVRPNNPSSSSSFHVPTCIVSPRILNASRPDPMVITYQCSTYLSSHPEPAIGPESIACFYRRDTSPQESAQLALAQPILHGRGYVLPSSGSIAVTLTQWKTLEDCPAVRRSNFGREGLVSAANALRRAVVPSREVEREW